MDRRWRKSRLAVATKAQALSIPSHHIWRGDRMLSLDGLCGISPLASIGGNLPLARELITLAACGLTPSAAFGAMLSHAPNPVSLFLTPFWVRSSEERLHETGDLFVAMQSWSRWTRWQVELDHVGTAAISRGGRVL